MDNKIIFKKFLNSLSEQNPTLIESIVEGFDACFENSLLEATRKTEDEYQIHGYYEGGWEEVTAETTFKEAKARVKEYRANEPKTQFKIIKKRVKVQPKEETKK